METGQPTSSSISQTGNSAMVPGYHDSTQPVFSSVEDLLARMTLEEKIGQMTQVEKNSITPGEVAEHFIGSVLSGGGGYPPENTPAAWAAMVASFQEHALRTRLGIPILYGVDAVHGHNNVRGAVIFPHNIGLGAARDPGLVYRIARATAEEMAATGVLWNFAPTVAIPQDIRWGRTYEGFGEDTPLVTALAEAYVRGLQGEDLTAPTSVLANPKHYLGDGGTTWATSTTVHTFWEGSPTTGSLRTGHFRIDQGDMRVDEATLRAVYLPPYIAAIRAGALIVMASFSSWNGKKLHAHKYLLTDVLKGELGFSGFVVTDWGGIDQISPDYYQAVVTAINAGVDMSMVPMEYRRFIRTMTQAVENGDVSVDRIDDAVSRILSVKFKMGLFERSHPDPESLILVGSHAHRALGREAVAKTLVLLKNEDRTLPLSKSSPLIYVAGQGADDIGLQCGGWTIEWLGKPGDITPGTTILQGIMATVSPGTRVEFDVDGRFEKRVDRGGNPVEALAGILVLSEMPYAEGFGDQEDLTLSQADRTLIESMRPRCKKLILILLSGRPRIVTDVLPMVDAFVAAWLPGTEGLGVADVLFGDVPFNGKLSYSWPRSMDQIPLGASRSASGEEGPLFPYGFGLP